MTRPRFVLNIYNSLFSSLFNHFFNTISTNTLQNNTFQDNLNIMALVPFSRPIPSNQNDTDERPRTIIFTSNDHVNASVQDRLTSADQLELYDFRGVDIIIIGQFSRTQIQNRPSYLNAVLIQSRGVDARFVSIRTI